MKRTFCGAVVLCLVSAVAAPAASRIVPRNTKLFVEQMDNDLDGYIRAEITKEKLPIILVLEKDAADLVMVGAGQDRQRKWSEWLTGAQDHAEGNISIINPREKTIVWS